MSIPDKTEKLINEKKSSLLKALNLIEQQYGKGTVMRMSDNTIGKMDVISTGCLAIDAALGVGGLPRGRIIEIYGPESSGKTTLALHVVAEAQKMGGTCAFVDVEHALDPEYAKNLGVNHEELLISQPGGGEQALNIVEMLVKSNAVDVVVLDSVAALITKAELEGDMGDSNVGGQARLMSQAMRKLTAAISTSKTIVIFINQIRLKIGVMFGSPETTSGGNALKFYASVRLDVRRVESIKIGADIVGNRTKVKVVKNKVAPPFKTAEYDIMFGRGISVSASILDMAIIKGIMEKSGSWITYGDIRVGQGRENAKKYLEEHAHIMAEIDKKVRAIIFPEVPEVEPVAISSVQVPEVKIELKRVEPINVMPIQTSVTIPIARPTKSISLEEIGLEELTAT